MVNKFVLIDNIFEFGDILVFVVVRFLSLYVCKLCWLIFYINDNEKYLCINLCVCEWKDSKIIGFYILLYCRN